MLALLVVLQVIVALFLILVVLLQPGNKGGMGAALGGGGGDTVFGGRGANTFLSKLTFGAAALFMITSVALSFQSMPDVSVVSKSLQNQGVSQPQAPSDDPSAPVKTDNDTAPDSPKQPDSPERD